MTRRLSRTLGTLAVLAAALTTTGCTPGDDDATSAPTAPPETVEVTETVYGECVDGVATIVADDLDGPFDLGDCASVSIVGVDGSITLGEVEQLVLEGDRNTVVVADVGRVAFGGNGNTVEHGGDEPEVVDEGDDNTVTPTG
ncbi:DUF3060 domain-containing protein [Frigoribacterium sp. Leaf172]|uniref:DUF3060 domain-containing protein n=1 Tax=Frigoribacterium sp. Leaf172 TaxID=1736285 RepID=UPI0006F5AC67|nr:DUF3060 domain-containing protein [Frigoribacterium sp. Leaf172]KQR62906.1 hypothetical protein ASF89_13325 [Frigoribacterium sp. Leaf172]